MPSDYDRSRKRPIEIRVLDRRDEEGISEDSAAEHSGVAADAFLLMRVLVDEANLSMAFTAIEGWSMGEMSFDALFNLWLALTSHVAQWKTDRVDHEKLRAFAERVLNLMRMNVQLGRLAADQAVMATRSIEEGPVDPLAPTEPPEATPTQN